MGSSAFKDTSELKTKLHNLSQKMGEQKNSWRFQELLYRVKLCSLDAKIGKPQEWNSRLAQQIEGVGKTKKVQDFVSKMEEISKKRYNLYRKMNREIYGLGFFSGLYHQRRDTWKKWCEDIRDKLTQISKSTEQDKRIEQWIHELKPKKLQKD